MAQFKQYLKSCTAAFKVKLPGQSTGRGCAVVLDLIKWYYDDDCDCGDDKTKFHDFQVKARVWSSTVLLDRLLVVQMN